MDPFSLALAFSVEPSCSAAKAPSQAAMDLLCKDVGDEDSPVMAASSCPEPITPPKMSRPKRALSQSESQAGSRKQKVVAVDNCLQFTQITLTEGNSIQCISCDGMPVPLWNQYSCKWKDVDFADFKCIKVGYSEPWVKNLVCAVAVEKKTGHHRDVIKMLTDKMKIAFHTSLEASAHTRARVSHDPMADAEPEIDENLDIARGPRQRPRAVGFCPVVDIEIGGFPVLCVNHKNYIAFKVDDATVAFILGWMLPLVKGIMDKPHQVAKPRELTSHPTTTSSKPAGFVFNSCYTPNVRDKVAWVPEKNAWQLYVKHPTDDSETRQFVVNPDQPSDQYEQQKTDAYCRAVNAWNRLDGTKRHRIPEVIASQKCD